jgi:hypothetical protein
MDRVELYCACGGHLIAEAAGHDAASAVKRSFWNYHTGPGHQPVTREEWEEKHSTLGLYGSYDSSVPVLAEDLIFAP